MKPWGLNNIFDATKEGPMCLQYDEFFQGVHGVEDCLRLNIYTYEVISFNKYKILNFFKNKCFLFSRLIRTEVQNR